MTTEPHPTPPEGGRISIQNGLLQVPDHPIIPFIEGDGTGRDIWRASVRVFDAAVEVAYGGARRIEWREVLAGEKAFSETGDWLPEETVATFRDYLVGIKGPLTTPVGGGIRSLNVALRQLLDLYVCLRPVKWYQGVPSPVYRPDQVDMVIFRENSEDIYAGVEYREGTAEVKKLVAFLRDEMGVKKIRFPETSGIGIKPVSREGTERLVRAAIRYALKQGRRSVTLVHKGNIMKFTEGAFRDWGYALAAREFRAETVSERESWILSNRESGSEISTVDNARAIAPGYDLMPEERRAEVRDEVEGCLSELWDSHGNGQWKDRVLVRDAIADITLQQVLTRASSFDVIATMNLNGDYLSDALAAQIGGIGIAPRRKHQLRHRTRHLRGHPRDGAQVRRPGQGESRFGDPVRGDDVPSSALGRGRRPDRAVHRSHDRPEAGDLRLPPADGRRDQTQDLGVRGRDHREHGHEQRLIRGFQANRNSAKGGCRCDRK